MYNNLLKHFLFKGYAPWQHDRSQDDLLMAQQEAQQRDPQGELVY